MGQEEENDPEVPTTSGPLAELVQDKLNKAAEEETAEEVEEVPEAPPRSGVTEYARGTSEHEDDRETS